MRDRILGYGGQAHQQRPHGAVVVDIRAGRHMDVVPAGVDARDPGRAAVLPAAEAPVENAAVVGRRHPRWLIRVLPPFAVESANRRDRFE